MQPVENEGHAIDLGDDDASNSSISYRIRVENTSRSTSNHLNDLGSQEWVEFTKSWFIENPPKRGKELHLHPAKYPESMVQKFISYFTKTHENELIFDPFCGTGSTMVAIDELNRMHYGNRRGYGIELSPNYAKIATKRTKQSVDLADSTTVDVSKLPEFDFIMTSPPYWNVLNKDTGHINSARQMQGLDVVYSADDADIGNIEDYDEFIQRLSDAFARFSTRLKDKKFCVVVLSSTNRKGRFFPIPYDFAREVQSKSNLVWKGERIWCQDNKPLQPYGYPFSFVPTFMHHTCLIFRNEL